MMSPDEEGNFMASCGDDTIVPKVFRDGFHLTSLTEHCVQVYLAASAHLFSKESIYRLVMRDRDLNW